MEMKYNGCIPVKKGIYSMKKVLERTHPAVLLVYFLVNFVAVVWSRHPWMTGIQTVCLCTMYLYHQKNIKKLLPYGGVFCLAAITNPLFVQRGRTILFYIGNIRITWEAFLYGIHYGCLLVNVLWMFSIMNRYFRREHWIYISGSVFPQTGVILSMAMGLIPKYKKQAGLMMEAQKNLKKESMFRRVMKVFSMETTWAFENSMDQLDSMNARGYGMKKRSHFHLFQFERKDMFRLVQILLLAAFNGYGYVKYYSRFFFYPMIIWNPVKNVDCIFIILMAIQILLPFLWRDGNYVSD